ncbi:MAG TPA: polyamine ABC transporter substrate-binding protein [Stellaceae bacterium]|jgi:putrescine transport system substrate-binding protein|nr:polyamine ABC transporter substrate-binding protein [Stellaceae bacterium]
MRWLGRWGAALVIAAAPGIANAEAPVLHVYNWSDYIAPKTIANFARETGIRVTYDVYDSNEVLEAKLFAGQSGYDVVVPSASPFMARQIAAGVYQPLDRGKLSGWKNLDPKILALVAAADPGNAHGVPYLWSVTGLGYNRAMVRGALGDHAPADSWALLFDPANAQKLASCGISLLDTPQEVVPATLAYLGLDPKSRDPGDLNRAMSALEKIRPYIRKFHSSEYINDLANGDLCLSLGYSGDVVMARNRAREAHNGVEITFTVPKEGAQMSVDMLGVPADAPHPENALRFVDYLLRPAVIADISDAVSYPNPNVPGTALVKPALRDDPAVYSPPEVRRRFFVDLPAPADYERARTRAWTRLKSGE